MEGAYNRCKLPRLTIGGSEGEKVSNVDAGDGSPTIEVDHESLKTDVGKAKKQKRRKAGSSAVSRQLSSQSTLRKYFHFTLTKPKWVSVLIVT